MTRSFYYDVRDRVAWITFDRMGEDHRIFFEAFREKTKPRFVGR